MSKRCQFENCREEVATWGEERYKFCELHKCTNCPQQVSKNEDDELYSLCEDCRCQYSGGCHYPKSEGLIYCDDHVCSATECDEEREIEESDDEFCADHTCPNCRHQKHIEEEYCDNCRAPRYCPYIVSRNGSTCGQLVRTGMYCDDHTVDTS